MRLLSSVTYFISALLVGGSVYAADAGAPPTSTVPPAPSSMPTSPPTGGGTELSYLQMIANNTYYALAAINNVPNYLDTITKMALSWMKLSDDDSSFILQSQADFANLGALYAEAPTAQAASAETLAAATYLGQSASDFTMPANSPKILEKFPDINNMFYSSLVGMPPAPKVAFSGMSFLQNSMGTLIPHAIPDVQWRGSQINKSIYSGYYKTIISANSFGAYILNNVVTENQNPQFKTLQNNLITKASQSSWLSQIATEELGKVLRDILLFQSQNYVLMTKQIELQKQMLVAQVMTNSLLVATNQGPEPKLLTDALGVTK